MKFPFAMLRDFVDTRLSPQEVGDLLTMAGFELEGVEDVEGDVVLDIKVTPNRGDGLSVFGLSREVLAKDSEARPTELYRRACGRFSMPDDADEGEAGVFAKVSIETEDCPRYACRMFRNVAQGEAPDWIQKRLRQAGMRPISLIVDLTNYVMLELGQPLHAFDLDTLEGPEIVVRHARPGERLTTLDGAEHELSPGQMMICDASKPVAVAGVMGGRETEVTPATMNVLLESANFRSTSVRRTRRQLGLSTEASYRFERSVDPDGVVAALNRFAELLEAVDGGASRVWGVVDLYPGRVVREPIRLTEHKTRRLLGLTVGLRECREYLERLGMEVREDAGDLLVTPPSWRPDLVREDDLIEEVGRVHGYEKIPEVLPQGSTPQGGAGGSLARIDLVREFLLRAGLTQVVSHSLVGVSPLDDPRAERIGPKNPVSPEAAWLRTSLLPCVAEAARRNGGRDLWLFEDGRTFLRLPDGPSERRNLALYSHGRMLPEHWVSEDAGQADFFALKGVVEELFAFLGLTGIWRQGSDPRLHPTRQAEVAVGDRAVGVLGVAHPEVARAAGLPEDCVLAEFDLEALVEAPSTPPRFRPVSRNPAVRRDVAVLVDKAVPYERIAETVRHAAGEVLERHWLFDRFEGQGIPEGKHSLAIALQLRKQGANFTDEEANQVRDRVVAALESLGATLR
ncbi:MAG: phenylalanine--tRNA ligase subunit beta [Fimbriimonadales bacterium]|nr:phenylalanine--tRNA ligase subunit beta [Fimbriimonadales bacterium]